MSVHTCTHRRLPKIPVNSALLPRWFALWQQGSLSLCPLSILGTTSALSTTQG